MLRNALALLVATPISLALQLPTPPAQAKGCQAPMQGRYAVMGMGTVTTPAGTSPQARLLEERWLGGGGGERAKVQGPGGDPAGAYYDLARTICRRAERCVVRLGEQEELAPQVLA